jgi:hypothetical protein
MITKKFPDSIDSLIDEAHTAEDYISTSKQLRQLLHLATILQLRGAVYEPPDGVFGSEIHGGRVSPERNCVSAATAICRRRPTKICCS